MSPDSSLVIVLFEEGWDASAFEAALAKAASSEGVLLVLPPGGIGSSLSEEAFMRILQLFRSKGSDDRVLIGATKHARVRAAMRRSGWKVLERAYHVRKYVTGHPLEAEVYRCLSPSLWRSHIRSRLQSLGLLSLPKVRIWILFLVSAFVFFFIFFKLFPSATIQVWPGEETITQTVNVHLVSSGVQLPFDRVRTLPLHPLTVEAERTLTFDEIGKEFTGTNARLTMTVFNDAGQQFSLRNGTRFTNQAGMIFRLSRDIIIPAKSSVTATAVADPVDLYGEIVGERGNVPAGIKWEIPGLGPEQRTLIYGRNEEPGSGGTTAHASVLQASDAVLAKRKLEQELLTTARQLIADERHAMNEQVGNASFVELRYDELTRISFAGGEIPQEFIGQNVVSIPVTGSIRYTVLLYDENALFELLKKEILALVGDERIVVDDSLIKDNLVLHVIDAPWGREVIDHVKLTVDLSARQRYNLDPLSPTGARFAMRVREMVTGKSVADAERITKNLPEVSRVRIQTWPPWSSMMPSIASNIIITEGQ